MKIWLYTLGSVVVVSLISLIGVFSLTWNKKRIKKILLFLVSFAVGALFGDAFIHLLPASFEKLGFRLSTSLYVLLGIIIFFVLEKFIRWRHCHIHHSEEHYHPVVLMNLIGDCVHNLIDGILIAASYNVSISLGFITTFAVILHEIPQEIGDLGILIYGGLSIKKALLFNFLVSLAAILGALIALSLGVYLENFSAIMLPVTAGGFIYIAGSDLIPELQHENEISTSIGQFFSLLLGIVVMALLTIIE